MPQINKIGIIRERKNPPDTRVPLTPDHCKRIAAGYPELSLQIESSPDRCFSDAEYEAAGIRVVHDVSDCDLLLGVKEVPTAELIAGKTYLFFSHTIKKQPYNAKLLRCLLDKQIHMVDYECLTTESNQRVIAFGRWAGIVGAHNGLMTYAERQGEIKLPRLSNFKDWEAVKKYYDTVIFPDVKAVITGNGRVSQGAAEVLDAMGFTALSGANFIKQNGKGKFYTMLDSSDMYALDKNPFDTPHFYANPELYHSIFAPYTEHADLMINGIYWHRKIPVFFTPKQMQNEEFKIRTIADITCDIAPVSSVPSTLRASTIAEPIYGYDPVTNSEIEPFTADSIDVMAVDNLPNELPRDASTDFGNQLLENVLPELLKSESEMITGATIAKNGELGRDYGYLSDYAASAVCTD